MQALESLNDNQVNDFLSGKSPLNLSVRLGDHMMLIQLQLSTLNPTSSSSSSSSTSSTPRMRSSSSRSRSSFPPTTTASSSRLHRSSGSSLRRHNSDSLCSSAPCSPKILAANDDDSSDSGSCLSSQEIDNIHSIVKSLSNDDDKTPIRSLSSLVSDPISANLTSCLCKRLDATDNSNSNTNECHNLPSTSAQSNLHKTAHNPITRHKNKVQSLNNSKKTINYESETSSTAPSPNEIPGSSENPALAEASRNLTQTLRKLSKRVFTNKISSISAEETNRNVTSGAVIESMKHHGKGIYSGTFSGTLNPALQDKFGRPKRDISTIIHILNDLLSAAPQCARSGTKIYFEPTTTAGGSTTTTATTSSPLRTSIAGTSSRTSAMMAKHVRKKKNFYSGKSIFCGL